MQACNETLKINLRYFILFVSHLHDDLTQKSLKQY